MNKPKKLSLSRLEWSWAMYDFANSAFVVIVMSAYFPAFYKKFWATGLNSNESSFWLAIGNSASSILVAIMAPLLGALSDKQRSGKKFFIFFLITGTISTLLLYFIPAGKIFQPLIVYGFACIGLFGSFIFYDSFLPQISSTENLNRVSLTGYALGYVGGGSIFLFCILMVKNPGSFGLTGSADAVRISFAFVSVWWLLFSIPLLKKYHVPINTLPVSGTAKTGYGIKSAYTEIWNTARNLRADKKVFTFLVAYWLYIDGVDTIIRMAIDYGMSIGLTDADLMAALLITQFVGFPAAYLYFLLSRKTGILNAILIGIFLYALITLRAAFIKNATEFYILAAMVGLIQGGVQSLSRSYFASLVPEGKEGEYFGFYNLLGKFAVFFGPLLIAGSIKLFSLIWTDTQIIARLSIFSLILLFISGFFLLLKQKKMNFEKH